MTVQITSKGATLTYGNEGLVADNPKDVLKILKEKGVAVYRGVLNEEECRAMNDGMWDTAEHLTSGLAQPLKRDDPETYKSVFNLVPKHGGLIQEFEWGHAQYVWDVRQNKKVGAVYRELYGQKTPLLTSFDGVNVSLGSVMPKGKKRGMFRGHKWLHTDQRLSDSSFLCVQSWVTANKIGVGDATLRCFVGSHDLHANFAKAFPDIPKKDMNSDWFKFSEEHLDWFLKNGAQDLCVTCEAGDQVFWDSRLVHSGTEFVNDEDCPERTDERTHRNVVYVCMQPREEKTLLKRARILNPDDEWRLRTASHWPNKMKLFGKYPQTYGCPPPAGCKQSDPKNHWSFVPKMPMPQLTPYGIEIALGRNEQDIASLFA
jgi:hypothetical protein